MRGIGESALTLLDEFYSEGRMDRFDGLSSDPKVSGVGDALGDRHILGPSKDYFILYALGLVV